MSTREVIDCDSCATTDVAPSYQINLRVGTVTVEGKPPITRYVQPDICASCLDGFITHLLTNVVTEQQQAEIARSLFPNSNPIEKDEG